MAKTREDVIAAVRAHFPDHTVANVLDLLSTYGVKPHERERERVQCAIVALSEGDEVKLRQFIGVAKRDYRDVLFWAEYPEESKLDTPEKRRVYPSSSRNLASKCPMRSRNDA